MTTKRTRSVTRLSLLGIVLLTVEALTPAYAACQRQLLPATNVGLRQSLQGHLREIGIGGFGRTQPYQDSTISILLDTDATLIVQAQDDVVIEVGAEVPLPADPIDLAKFNGLTALIASRFSSEDEKQLRARLLVSIGTHQTVGSWSERSDELTLAYTRFRDALLVKIRKEKC